MHGAPLSFYVPVVTHLFQPLVVVNPRNLTPVQAVRKVPMFNTRHEEGSLGPQTRLDFVLSHVVANFEH